MQVPAQMTDGFGLPTWITVLPGWNNHVVYAGDAFNIVAVALALGLAMHGIRSKRPFTATSSTASNCQEPTSLSLANHYVLLVGNLITAYVAMTLAAVIVSAIFEPGKIFAAVGIFHNQAELAICIALTNPSPWRVTPAVVFVDTAVIAILSIVLPWPLDATVFEVHGLTIDILVVIFFGRMVLAMSRAMETPVSKCWIICVAAAAVHMLGNIVFAAIPTFAAFVAFQFSYAIAFSLYGLAVYLIYPQDHLKLVPAGPSTICLSVALSAVIAASSVGTGLFIRASRAN